MSAKSTDLFFWRGAICALLGLFIVGGPHVLRSPFWIDLLAQSQAVGWFALAIAGLLFWQGWRNKRRS